MLHFPQHRQSLTTHLSLLLRIYADTVRFLGFLAKAVFQGSVSYPQTIKLNAVKPFLLSFLLLFQETYRNMCSMKSNYKLKRNSLALLTVMRFNAKGVTSTAPGIHILLELST